ncbi:hypothetical protein D9M71_576200 [compost metagenome]
MAFLAMGYMASRTRTASRMIAMPQLPTICWMNCSTCMIPRHSARIQFQRLENSRPPKSGFSAVSAW